MPQITSPQTSSGSALSSFFTNKTKKDSNSPQAAAREEIDMSTPPPKTRKDSTTGITPFVKPTGGAQPAPPVVVLDIHSDYLLTFSPLLAQRNLEPLP